MEIIEDNVTIEKNETLVLFLDDCNGYRRSNMGASLVAVSDFIYNTVKNSEEKQTAARRTGGNWKQALEDSNMNYRIIAHGVHSEFSAEPFKSKISYEYKVISGNY